MTASGFSRWWRYLLLSREQLGERQLRFKRRPASSRDLQAHNLELGRLRHGLLGRYAENPGHHKGSKKLPTVVFETSDFSLRDVGINGFVAGALRARLPAQMEGPLTDRLGTSPGATFPRFLSGNNGYKTLMDQCRHERNARKEPSPSSTRHRQVPRRRGHRIRGLLRTLIRLQ
jgi:hypothetical protein